MTEATNYRAELSKALVLANTALTANVGLHLEAGWKLARKNDPSCVPVYLVSGRWLSSADKMFVPDGERFIIVNADRIAELPVIFHEAGHSHSNATMAVPTESYLGLILLHELGHIYLGHAGSYSALPEHLDTDLNLVVNPMKTTELAADGFAASQIKAQSALKTFELRLALQNISWNMQVWRSLEYFGSASTFVPEVYWDQGYSHPNLAFRMLIIGDLVESNYLSHQMVQMFVDGRNRKPWNKVLGTISSVDQITEIARNLGYTVQVEKLPDRQRVHLEYRATRTRAFVDVWPGKERAAIREIGEAIGLNF